MHRQDHVAGVEGDDGIGVSGDSVQEEEDLFHCVFGGGSLFGGEGSKCCEHGEVNGARIVEENANHLLDKFLVSLGEGG